MKEMKKVHYGINPKTAATAGAIIGLGVGIAGTLVVSNKNNQNKVKGAFNNAKNKVTEIVEDAKAKIDGNKELVTDSIAEGKKKATNTLKTVKIAKKKVKNIWQK